MHLPLLFARRYLLARKSHNVINIISGISVAGMAIGTAALIIILSVYNGFSDLVEKTLGEVQPQIRITPSTGKVFSPKGLEAIGRIRKDPSVLSVCETLEENVVISYDGKQSLAKAKGVDSLFEQSTPVRDHIVEGVFSLHKGDIRQGVFGATLAYGLGISPRFLAPAELYYPKRDGNVSLSSPLSSLNHAKVYPSGLFAISANTDTELVLVPIETMRELTGYRDEVSAIEIRTVPGAGADDERRLIDGLSRALGPSFKVSDRIRQNDALFKMMKYEKLAIFVILIFVIIIIAFNIFSSLSMLIIEKQHDIGTLRSLGADESLIRRIFILEGWLISLLGLAIGLVIGVAFVLLQQKFGLIKMPGSYVVPAYPVILKGTDLLLTAAGVASVGYLIAALPHIIHKTNQI